VFLSIYHVFFNDAGRSNQSSNNRNSIWDLINRSVRSQISISRYIEIFDIDQNDTIRYIDIETIYWYFRYIDPSLIHMSIVVHIKLGDNHKVTLQRKTSFSSAPPCPASCHPIARLMKLSGPAHDYDLDVEPTIKPSALTVKVNWVRSNTIFFV
jgi:hypothetical protein